MKNIDMEYVREIMRDSSEKISAALGSDNLSLVLSVDFVKTVLVFSGYNNTTFSSLISIAIHSLEEASKILSDHDEVVPVNSALASLYSLVGSNKNKTMH